MNLKMRSSGIMAGIFSHKGEAEPGIFGLGHVPLADGDVLQNPVDQLLMEIHVLPSGHDGKDIFDGIPVPYGSARQQRTSSRIVPGCASGALVRRSDRRYRRSFLSLF